MTTPKEIYEEASKRGLRLEPAGDKLAVLPKGKCPADFAELLRANKPALLEWLSRPPCPGHGSVPPANLPLVGLQPQPPIRARELVIHYLLRQCADKPGGLSEWLVRRESEYFDGPGAGWDCGALAYAAARDAACWQLNRRETDVWQLLDEFEEVAAKPTKQDDK